MASLGWIHYSRQFRDRVHTILDMMDEEGVVDELGVGAFRDAFADIFFPGISTIQTRAKYFFIIPYLIKDYLNLSPNHQKGLDQFLYEAEHKIMWNLAAMYNYDRRSGSGVIGITKRQGIRIGTRPSSVYWNGVRTLGFIRTGLSLSEYGLRIQESLSDKITRTLTSKKEDGDDEDVDLAGSHGIRVSTYHKNWKHSLDMPLAYEEADFFRQAISRFVPDSLLHQIINNEVIRTQFLDFKEFRSFVTHVIKQNLTKELKANLVLAHDLDVVVEGLHWVYSNEINRHRYQDEQLFENWLKWKKSVYSNIIDLKHLKGERLVTIAPRSNRNSKLFIIRICDLIREKNLDYNLFAGLVRDQETNVKTYKSRFRLGAEIDFRRGDTKSLAFLNYRYSKAQTIVNDIFASLTQTNA
jgi:hypothetical protein